MAAEWLRFGGSPSQATFVPSATLVSEGEQPRHTTVSKNGKTHTYWRLVRSVRIGSKVRQETVAHLGELSAHGCAEASALARKFLGRKAAQLGFFDETRPELMPVRLDRARMERSRSFGDVWLG